MNILGNNIRTLRKNYGETQNELSAYLCSQGFFLDQHYISNFETGKRTPDKDLIKEIADHYQVSVDALLFDDFSKLKYTLSVPQNNNNRIQILKNLFPIIKSEEAIKNLSFSRALSDHIQFVQALYTGDAAKLEDMDNKLDNLFGIYEESAASGILEAKANTISLMLFLYNFLITGSAVDILGEDFDFEKNTKRFIKTYSQLQGSNTSKERNYFCEIVNGMLLDYVHDLKLSGKYSDLGDYFLLLMYQYNIVRSEMTMSQAKEICLELCNLLRDMNNKFVLRMLKVMKGLVK